MIDSFLQYLQFEKNYSQHTIASYHKDLIEFADYHMNQDGATDWKNLTFQDVRYWMLYLSESGKKASTINRKLSALKSFYKFHNASGTIKNNPTLKVIAPQKEKPLPAFFQEKDLEKLLQIKKNCSTFEDIRNLMIIEMFYQTGMRISELVGLNDVGVDTNTNTIKVLGKGNKERIIPFGPDLLNRISDYLEIRNHEIENVDESFFKQKNGRRINKPQVYNIVKENMSLVSTLHKRSPHVLRHTFATTMLNNGADINAIKNILGHESLRATEVYTHTTFDQLHDIYQQAHPRAEKKRRNHEH